jgi:hypothetical protein
MPKITYQVQGQGPYADVTVNNIIHVMKGTTLSFKLAGPGLPPNSMPQAVTKTYAQTSASTADLKDQVVSCGNVNMTVRAVVYELTLVSTPLDNFAGRSQTDLGIDERVNLSFTVAPGGVTAAQAGGLKWAVHSETFGPKNGGTLQKSATDKGPVSADGTAHYIAPYMLSSAALTFPPGALSPAPISLRKTVTLKLEVQTGPSKGKHVTKDFTIHVPQAEMLDNRNQHQHVQNFPSAGFRGDIYLRPRSVSFRTLEWREAGGLAKAYATATPNLKGGYFVYDHGKPHHPTGTNPSGGKFTSEVRTVADGDATNGCWVRQLDTVWSGYDAAFSNANPIVPSTMVWPIYWQYRVAGGADKSWNTFQKAEHKAEMAADGSVTISKAGASFTATLAAATVAFP